jgi:hypothetical protein
MSLDKRTKIKGTTLGRGTESNQKFPVQSKGRKSVADTLFKFWRRSPNRSPELFKRYTLLGTNSREVLIEGFWFRYPPPRIPSHEINASVRSQKGRPAVHDHLMK